MPRTISSLLLLPALFLVVLVFAAGCGGGSGSESSGGGETTVTEANGGGSDESGEESESDSGSSNVDKTSPSYQGGYEICEFGSVEYVAGLFGAEPTPEAVADAVAEQVGGAAGEDEFAAGRQGCLDALASSG